MPPLFNPELERLFGGANLNIEWRAIVTAGSYVSRAYLSHIGPLELGCVFVPWFTRDGEPVCHASDRQYPGLPVSHPQAGDSLVTVDKAARPEFRHPWMSEERINAHRPHGPVQLTLPAYYVERGYLLLDG